MHFPDAKKEAFWFPKDPVDRTIAERQSLLQIYA